MPGDHPEHECYQEVNLARLTMATETLVKSVDQLTLASREQLKVIETMAEQGARLDAVECRTAKLEHDTDGIYDRVRSVELYQARRTGGLEVSNAEEKETKTFRTTVKAMLLVAIVLGGLTAFLWLLDKNDYGISITQITTKAKK